LKFLEEVDEVEVDKVEAKNKNSKSEKDNIINGYPRVHQGVQAAT
jgi:hypothetical protein